MKNPQFLANQAQTLAILPIHEIVGWPVLYSDMSKIGNVILPGQQIDKHDEISE